MSTRANDAYSVLGVEPSVDDDAIQAAYRRLARRYHPDIAGETATKRMMKINAAFDRVRDPVRRAEYDIELDEIDPIRAAKARRRPQHHDPSSPTAGRGRPADGHRLSAGRPPGPA